MTDPIKPSVAIFDLDGCVSDDRWRKSLLPPEGSSGDEAFAAYHAECDKDPVLPSGGAILREHIAQGHLILFCTARPIKVGEVSASWISSNFGITPDKFSILMRKENDIRGSVALKKEFAEFILLNSKQNGQPVVAAYDDRADVVDMYRTLGLNAAVLDVNGIQPPPPVVNHPTELPEPSNTEQILNTHAATFGERNAVYKDNAVNVGAVMKGLFPHGVRLQSADDHHIYHLFELMIVKLTRYANSGLRHQDSIHDLVIYAAMVEGLTAAAKHGIEVAP